MNFLKKIFLVLFLTALCKRLVDFAVQGIAHFSASRFLPAIIGSVAFYKLFQTLNEKIPPVSLSTPPHSPGYLVVEAIDSPRGPLPASVLTFSLALNPHHQRVFTEPPSQEEVLRRTRTQSL